MPSRVWSAWRARASSACAVRPPARAGFHMLAGGLTRALRSVRVSRLASSGPPDFAGFPHGRRHVSRASWCIRVSQVRLPHGAKVRHPFANSSWTGSPGHGRASPLGNLGPPAGAGFHVRCCELERASRSSRVSRVSATRPLGHPGLPRDVAISETSPGRSRLPTAFRPLPCFFQVCT